MVKDIILLLRPKQWIKNLVVLTPLIFALKFGETHLWVKAFIAVFGFILVSSCVYIFNDIWDIKEDRKHPTKKNRPIARGAVPVFLAWILIFSILSIFFVLSDFLPHGYKACVSGYFLVQIAYTIFLKHQAIIDVMVISMGFVFRVVAGAFAIGVLPSVYIILTIYLGAMYLGFGKRYYEFNLGEEYRSVRKSLGGYTKEILMTLVTISCGLTGLSYALYTISTGERLEKHSLVMTCAFVLFGLFRYLQHIYLKKGSGKPEDVFFKDWVFILNIFLWLASTTWILID